jgi:nucleoid-associated protein YgaU
MKIKGKTLLFLSVFSILLLVFGSIVFGQEEDRMKMDEYKAQLAGMQEREASSTERINALEAEIEELNKQIAEVQTQIDSTWEKVYVLVGTDKATVDALREELASIESEIGGLDALSAEELFQRRDEIKGIEKRIEEAKGNELVIITEIEKKIEDLEAQVANLKAKLPANIYDQYTVVGGDYLWKISNKDEIYGDPYQWIRIYSVNKDQIKDADLIYPDQVFNIARGVGENEYLVEKGDFLAKIAGYAQVYSDPTKWTKIYEANKDMISEASLIYPHQVLVIPAE